jgi:acyl carrier protein
MDSAKVLETLNRLFADVIGKNGIALKRETTARDVAEWDSLNHIQFIVAIEKHFKVKFTRAEIRAWQNVGQMADAVARAAAG